MADNLADIQIHKSIEDLRKEVVNLKRENNAAMLTIDKLLKDLNKKHDEIKHLQSLVSQAVPVIKKETSKLSAPVSAEEEIAQVQLEKLRLTAKTRTLTLEEVRTFDLLVKNKRLVLDESTINLGKNSYRDVGDAELLKLAAAEVKPSGEPDDE
jgi:predicted  nucleic acid-binding Zn-ribbon protein